MKVAKRQSVDREYNYDGVSVVLGADFMKLYDEPHNKKIYHAYLKNPNTISLRSPAVDRSLMAHYDQTEVNAEACLQEGFNGMVGHAIENNWQYVEQDIVFPFELSVQHIQENRYEEKVLPFTMLPVSAYVKAQPGINNKQMRLSFNAIIPSTKAKTEGTEEDGQQDMYRTMIAMGFPVVPNNDFGSRSQGATVVPDGFTSMDTTSL